MLRVFNKLEQHLLQQGACSKHNLHNLTCLAGLFALLSKARVNILQVGEYPALQVKRLLA